MQNEESLLVWVGIVTLARYGRLVQHRSTYFLFVNMVYIFSTNRIAAPDWQCITASIASRGILILCLRKTTVKRYSIYIFQSHPIQRNWIK
jgi:hypothetical protein